MIIYNGKNSKTDFDLYIASREQPPAQRKVITETVPYMSGLWDFSYHDGNIDEYEAVKLKYTFDVIADSKQELKALRGDLIAWIHSKGENKLIDTDISETAYYNVYHAQASWSEEGLQGLLTVEFTCYPFMLTEKKTEFLKLTTEAQSVTINNEGSRVITPTIRVVSINLFDISKVNSSTNIKNNGDGTLTVKGTGASAASPNTLKDYAPNIKVGETYTLSADTTSTKKYIYLKGEAKAAWFFGAKRTITENDLNAPIGWYADNDTASATISNIQIEFGEAATEYTPYVEPAATISDGVNSYTISGGEHKCPFTLKAGENTLNISGTGLLSVAYTEEEL